ncbi:MAG: hypothetical protein AB7S36_05610, partial [Planctomycetota bacterium]
MGLIFCRLLPFGSVGVLVLLTWYFQTRPMLWLLRIGARFPALAGLLMVVSGFALPDMFPFDLSPRVGGLLLIAAAAVVEMQCRTLLSGQRVHEPFAHPIQPRSAASDYCTGFRGRTTAHIDSSAHRSLSVGGAASPDLADPLVDVAAVMAPHPLER